MLLLESATLADVYVSYLLARYDRGNRGSRKRHSWKTIEISNPIYILNMPSSKVEFDFLVLLKVELPLSLFGRQSVESPVVIILG